MGKWEELIERVDGDGYREYFDRFEEDFWKGWKAASESWDDEFFRSFNHIYVVAMGGSAIVPLILAEHFHMNVSVRRYAYTPPAWLSEDTLLVYVSYSGNTYEVVKSFESGLKSSLQKLVITSGGELLRMAVGRERVKVVKLPEGYLPRAALPYVMGLFLYAAMRFGMLGEISKEAVELKKSLKKMKEEFGYQVPYNPLYEFAEEHKDYTFLVWGYSGYTSKIAYRWKTQINENAKLMAFSSDFPEAAHNEIVPLVERENAKVVVNFLKWKGVPDFFESCWHAAKSTLTEGGLKAVEWEGKGATFLSQLLTLIHLGDYLSYYLALARGIEPSRTVSILAYKDKLGGEIR